MYHKIETRHPTNFKLGIGVEHIDRHKATTPTNILRQNISSGGARTSRQSGHFQISKVVRQFIYIVNDLPYNLFTSISVTKCI